MEGCNLGQTPEHLLIERSRQLVLKGINSQWKGPAFDPIQLAHLLGIKTKHVQEIEAEAQIVPLSGQFELQFRRDVSDKRLNFTFCHEIAHTLFPDCANMIHYRNTHRSSFDPDREVEYLCDIGAAEILMPSPYFENDLRDIGVSLLSVNSLSERYQASREAIIRRIPSTNLGVCAVVYLSFGYRKEELKRLRNPQLPFEEGVISKPIPKLRITKVHASQNFDVFLPFRKSIPDNSSIYQVVQGQEYISCEEHWDIPKFGKRKIEAVRLYNFGTSERLGILALVH